MSFDSEPEDSKVIQQFDALLRLTSRVFQDYCSDKQVAAEAAPHTVDPFMFLAWVKESSILWNTEYVRSICLEAGVDECSYDKLIELSEDPVGGNQLAGVWPQVTLKYRGNPVNQLESMHTVCLLKWSDGTVSPLSAFTPKEFSCPEGVFTDGNVATLLQINACVMTQVLIESSLDRLYDRRSNPTTEHAYETVIGLILNLLQGGTINDDSSGELQVLRISEELRPACLAVVQVLQAMYRPPVPIDVQRKIASQRKQQEANRQNDNGEEPPVGGWNF